MAVNKNVKDALFSTHVIGNPRNFRLALESETIEDSAGIDKFISSHDIVRARVAVQVAFGDIDSAITLSKSFFGTEGPLTLSTEELGTDTEKSISVANARCIGVVTDAQHADAGSHIATFVGRTTDGSTNPVS